MSTNKHFNPDNVQIGKLLEVEKVRDSLVVDFIVGNVEIAQVLKSSDTPCALQSHFVFRYRELLYTVHLLEMDKPLLPQIVVPDIQNAQLAQIPNATQGFARKAIAIHLKLLDLRQILYYHLYSFVSQLVIPDQQRFYVPENTQFKYFLVFQTQSCQIYLLSFLQYRLVPDRDRPCRKNFIRLRLGVGNRFEVLLHLQLQIMNYDFQASV